MAGTLTAPARSSEPEIEGRATGKRRPAPTLVHRRVIGCARTVDLATEALKPTVIRSTETPAS